MENIEEFISVVLLIVAIIIFAVTLLHPERMRSSLKNLSISYAELNNKIIPVLNDYSASLIMLLIIFGVIIFYSQLFLTFIEVQFRVNLSHSANNQYISVEALKNLVENVDKNEYTLEELEEFSHGPGAFTLFFSRLFHSAVVIGSMGLVVFHAVKNFIEIFSPVFGAWDFLNLQFLLKAKEKEKEEDRLKRHEGRRYETTVLVGWNAFEYKIEVVNNVDKEYAKLIIPTETQFEFADFLKNDTVLLEKVLKTVKSPEGVDSKDCPSFMVVLDDEDDQFELMRRVTNKLSETIKSSEWVDYIHHRKTDKMIEPAIVVLTCEKGRDVPRKFTRVWMMFESELKKMYHISDDLLTPAKLKSNNPDAYFRIDRSNWDVRLKNLRSWARAEFEEGKDGKLIRKRKTPYQSCILNLPISHVSHIDT